jgi:hypothetical protein
MRIAIIAAAAALALSAQVSAAQQPGPPQPPDQRAGGGGMPGMAEQMRVMDSLNARLDTLVIRMNRATGNRKVAAIADVINELVAQRKAMQQHMRQMMESRQGMMLHMMGDSAPAQGRRPPTPTTDSAAADTGHAAHHPPN